MKVWPPINLLHLGRLSAPREQQWFGLMPIIVAVLAVVRQRPTIFWNGLVFVEHDSRKIPLVSFGVYFE